MSNGRPVHIRRNIENYGDPYTHTHSQHETLVCCECRAVYHDQRWYLEDQGRSSPGSYGDSKPTTCPACMKIRDRMPGGIVKLSGGFLKDHREEILNLIRNEGDRARQVNPLERVMGFETLGAGIDVFTTNEKLAQRIGRALHKAYEGRVSYDFSQDTKLARVTWRRD